MSWRMNSKWRFLFLYQLFWNSKRIEKITIKRIHEILPLKISQVILMRVYSPFFGQKFLKNRHFGQISKWITFHKWSLLTMWSNLCEFWPSFVFGYFELSSFWHFELFLGLNWNEYFRNSVLISKFIFFCLSICLTKTTVAILDQFDLTLWNNHRSKSLCGLKRHFSIKKSSKNSFQIILEMMSST